MKLSLCPRCELNYITESEQYCKVCLQEMHGSAPVDEVELCSICNENPVLPGRDVCLVCLKEMGGSTSSTDESDRDEAVDGSSIGMDSVATMDEILPVMEDDIPSQEFGEIDNALSLESVREEEEKEQEEDEDEDK